MNAELFSEAMNEIDAKYYEEAAEYPCQKHRRGRFTSLAACAAVVSAVLFAAIWKLLPGQTVSQPELNPPIITEPDNYSNRNSHSNPDNHSNPNSHSNPDNHPNPDDPSNPDNHPDHTERAISLNLNEISTPDAVISSIALMGDDYISMSYEELLAYFDVSLPIAEILPCLTLRSKDFGIYQSEERNIYFDGNSIVFENSDGTQSITIVLSKVCKHTYDLFDLRGNGLNFTDVNGRELAVFHYTKDGGADCYSVEFLQDDVAFIIRSENISAEDYAVCLQALVNEAQESRKSPRTITGEIIAVDPYANHIGILVDEEKGQTYSRGYGIDLPDGQPAEGYSLGGRVEVTYMGEPATILTIWAEQFVDIKSLP